MFTVSYARSKKRTHNISLRNEQCWDLAINFMLFSPFLNTPYLDMSLWLHKSPHHPEGTEELGFL